MNNQQVVILGAGPSQDRVGGNAGSFDLNGAHCDSESHRLHPVALPEIMDDLRRLPGSDLMYQSRHGSVLLQGRWIHFPLKPLDLYLRLPKSFALRVLGYLGRKVVPRGRMCRRRLPRCSNAVWAGLFAASSTSPAPGSCGASILRSWR